MRGLRIALPTVGHSGMRDRVSEVFSRARTLTIVDIAEGRAASVEVVDNSAADLSQGAGPMVVKTLKEKGVDVVLSGELGPGASTLLDTVGIKAIRVEAGMRVSQAIKRGLADLN